MQNKAVCSSDSAQAGTWLRSTPKKAKIFLRVPFCRKDGPPFIAIPDRLSVGYLYNSSIPFRDALLPVADKVKRLISVNGRPS